MNWFATRMWLVGVLFLGGGALAWTQSSSEFAYIEARSDEQSLRFLRSEAIGTSSEVALVSGTGTVTVELPSSPAPGVSIQIPAVFEYGAIQERGFLTLDVQESTRFVTGRLSGSLGGWELAGGLRVRAHLPGNEDHQEVAVRQ